MGTTVLTSSQKMPPTIQGPEQGLTTVRCGLPSALVFGRVNVQVNAPKLSGTRAVVSFSNFVQ